jgi:glycosyltransferase involved in cell wall biosynthesis
MNILSITNCPLDPRSGSGKTVLHYTSGLRGLGHEVEVYEPKDYLLAQKMYRGSKVRLAAGAWPILRSRVKDGALDVLEFYGDEFGVSIWQLANARRRPLLVAHTNGLEILATARARTDSPPKNGSMVKGLVRKAVLKSHDWFSSLAFANADAFVALCELDRKHVVGLGYFDPDFTAVVEPGLDPQYLEVPWDSPREERVAFTGSWIARKGIDLVAKVMGELLAERPRLELDVFGSGNPPETVRAAFPEAVRARVLVHPRLPEKDIAAVLARSKGFFFPTQYEGFGIALAEAMACGCASVTTATGFGAELVDGTEAVLCDFRDGAAMTTALRRILDDDAYRKHLARGGWERTRSLTWEANVRKLETVYRRWTSSPPARLRAARA